jgi:type II secretory pathway component PulF
MSALINFEYRAVDRAGVERRGMVAAATREEAFRKVSALGATPTRLRAIRQRVGRVWRRGRISAREVSQLAYQLSVLAEARMPLADGIRGVAESEPNERFKGVLLDVATRIAAGAGVTDALAAHREVFGDVFVETVRAAEKSGNLIAALEQLAEMLEQRAEAGRQIKQAMTYPVVVLIAMGTAVLFLIAFVIPRFAEMFASRGAKLPLLTRALQGLGLGMQEYWWAWAIGAACAVCAVRAMMKSAEGKRRMDRFLRRVPYLRETLTALAIGRFARTLGLCVGSGLGLIESLSASGRASGSPALMEDVERLAERVRQGGRLSEALPECRQVPVFARRMLSAGEQAAELPRMCGIVAKRYERDASARIKSSATVIEPLLIAGLTGVALIVALAIFLPMWDMVGLVK